MMYLHLGADVVVNMKHLVMILDLKTAGAAEASRQFIESLPGRVKVTDISGGEPKSLVLTDKEAFFSPISTLTLKRRAGLGLSDAVRL